jgi:hypothetical protein
MQSEHHSGCILMVRTEIQYVLYRERSSCEHRA